VLEQGAGKTAEITVNFAYLGEDGEKYEVESLSNEGRFRIGFICFRPGCNNGLL
jgi:hypothetical protein